MDTLKQRPLLWITALAGLLRLPTLAIESLWYDEAFTAWLSSLPLDAIFEASQGDVHPPTWYLIEWMMVHALGPSEIALRLVSALAGIALVPAVWRLARNLGFDRAAQGAAALVTAVAPFAVYYSQEARAYSLLYLLLTLAAVALLEQRWPWFVLASIGALYLHNLAVLGLLAVIWLGCYRFWRNIDGFFRFCLSLAVIWLAWLPWLVFGLIPQSQAVANGFWVRPPTWGTPVFVLISLFWSEKALLFGAVTAPLLALAMFNVQRSTFNVEAAAILIIPLGLGCIISLLVQPILLTRVVGFSAVGLYLLLGSIFAGSRPSSGTKLAWGFAAVLLAFYATYWGTDRIGRYPWDFGLPPNVVKASDGIFHANLATYIVYHYYLLNQQVVWRQANDLSQSLTDPTKAAMQMNQADFEDVACRHSRWWLAYYENPTTGPAERAEIARLVKKYDGQQVTTMLKNQLVNARLYLLDNVCQTAGVK